MISEEIVHIKGRPKKLIIFLHGYIDNPDYIDSFIHIFLDNLDDVAIHIPKAPHLCEIHAKKSQWYSMHRFDPNDDRKTIDNFAEKIKIYNRMKPGIIEAFNVINSYIDHRLEEYQLEDKDLILCGYSQGATLAIFSSLMREGAAAGVISFGGMFAPSDYLIKHHHSMPSFLLIHGNNDNQVTYEALEYTEHQLKNIGCKVTTYTILGGQHRITEAGMQEALKFIKTH